MKGGLDDGFFRPASGLQFVVFGRCPHYNALYYDRGQHYIVHILAGVLIIMYHSLAGAIWHIIMAKACGLQENQTVGYCSDKYNSNYIFAELQICQTPQSSY